MARFAPPVTHDGDAPPIPDVYDANGVDRSLVRRCLDKTPGERLDDWQELVDLINSVRRADGTRVS